MSNIKCQMSSRVSGRRGFTVLELIISVSLLAVAFSSIVFVLRNQLLGNLESDAQIIAARLEEAETRALSGVNGNPWGIHFDNSSSASSSYSLFQGPQYSAASTTYYLSNLVEFQTPASGASSNVVFAERAGTVATNTTIVIRLKGRPSSTKTINVSTQGRISVQ